MRDDPLHPVPAESLVPRQRRPFRRYTGQEAPDQRQEILADPPDVILTNYVMLELMLTRPAERRSLVEAAAWPAAARST